MNQEQFKGRYFYPIVASAHHKLDQCVVPDLPDRTAWMKGLIHPLTKAALLMFMEDDRYTFHWGQTRGTMYVSITDKADDEVMRLSAYIKQDEANALRQMLETGESGVWLSSCNVVMDNEPVEDQISPLRMRGMEGRPFGDMRNALWALEFFGHDDTIDIQHLGTFLSNSIARPSRITEYYEVDGGLWALTHRPVDNFPDETLRALTEVIFDQLDDTVYQAVLVRTMKRVGTPNAGSYFFPDPSKGYRPSRHKVSEESDAMVIIEEDQVTRERPPLLDAAGRATVERLMDDKDLISEVLYRLREQANVVWIHAVDVDSDPQYYVIRVATSGTVYKAYRIKVAK